MYSSSFGPRIPFYPELPNDPFSVELEFNPCEVISIVCLDLDRYFPHGTVYFSEGIEQEFQGTIGYPVTTASTLNTAKR